MKSIGATAGEITDSDPCRPECTVCRDDLPSVPRGRCRRVGAQAQPRPSRRPISGSVAIVPKGSRRYFLVC